MRIQARIEEVSIRTAGTSLDGDHPAGAKTLYVTSTSDFSELGGTFVCDDIQYNYDFVDFLAQTVRTTVGLVAAKESGERLDLLPIAQWKVATVRPLTPDDAPTDYARIHVGLAAFVQRGIRTEDEQESCVVERLGGELTVTQIDDQDPVFDGAYINPGTLPPADLPPLTDLEAPVTPTTLYLAGTGGLIVARWDEVPNADIVTYRLHLREGVVPTTGGQFEVAAGIGLTSAAVRLLKDGTKIDSAKTYYGIVTIEDDDGVGPGSQVATAKPDVISTGDLDPAVKDVIDNNIMTYNQDDPPWPNGTNKGASFTNDEWVDTNNNNLRHIWSGPDALVSKNQWIPKPLGPGATTNDVVAGKTIPIGSNFRLEWGVANPTSSFTTSASLSRYPVPRHADGLSRGTALVHWAPATGRWYAMNVHPVDTRLAEVVTWLDGDAFCTTAATITAEVLTGNTPNPDPAYATQWFTSQGSGGVGSFILLASGKWAVGTYSGVRIFSSTWAYEKYITVQGSGAAWVNGGSSNNFGKCMGVDEDGVTLLFLYQVTYKVNFVDTYHLHFVRINSTTGALVSYQNRAMPADINAGEYIPSIGSLQTAVVGTGSTKRYGGGYRYLNLFDTNFVHYPVEAIKADVGGGGEYKTPIFAASRWVYPTPTGPDGPPGYPSLAESYSWKQGIVGGSSSAVTVNVTYSLADTLSAGTGLHETVANTSISTVTVPAGSIFKFPKVTIPTGPDVDMPDSVYIYARVSGSGLPYTRQVPKGRAAGDYAVKPSQMPIELLVPLTTNGPQPPAASNFPQGSSGLISSESGGFIVRGDSTGDWPFFRELLQSLFDSRYSFAGHTHSYAPYVHTHPDYALVTDLNTEITARTNMDNRLKAVEADVTTLEGYNAKYKRQGTGTAPITTANVPGTATDISFSPYFDTDVVLPQHVSITLTAAPATATRVSVTSIDRFGFTVVGWRATNNGNLTFTYSTEGTQA